MTPVLRTIKRRLGASFFMLRPVGGIGALGCALLATALLLPVGDAPWYSFWREWTAGAAVIFVLLSLLNILRDRGLSLQWPLWSLQTAAIALAAVVWVQYAAGLVPWRGDAWLSSFYLTGFAFCVLVAGSLPHAERASLADFLAMALAVAGIVSAPLALLQWTGHLTLDMGMPVAGGRPVAHMEQANLLCSLSIQGALGVWRLALRHRIRLRTAALPLVPMLMTVALTQSRVVWLVGPVLLAVVAWRRDLLPWRPHGQRLAGMIAVVFTAFLVLPWLNEQWALAGAPLSERASMGRRPAVWALFIDAVWAQPFWGWGALQNGAAQYQVATRHVSLGWYFSSAHNLVLDLMVWFGAAIGLTAGAALLWATVRRLRGAVDAPGLVTALAAASLVLHALVELPLHYAYFLLPLGLMLGASRSDATSGATLHLPARLPGLIPALTLVPGLLLAALASDYIRLTDVRPGMVTDPSTRNEIFEAQLPPPEVLLLDQLQGLHRLAVVPLRQAVGVAQLDAAKAAMLRSPMAPVIERQALIAGLNGRTGDAQSALQRLCKFEPPAQCERSAHAWELWRAQWPQLPPWPSDAPP